MNAPTLRDTLSKNVSVKTQPRIITIANDETS